MKKKFYITTAIDYPSAPPHIGHVYEKVCADVIARWQRLQGSDVFFSTGTDEHGQKIQRCAEKANQSPGEFTEKMYKKFTALWEKLDISYDSFIRTTQRQHIKAVQAIFKRIYEKGDIYKGLYQGLYCVDCEAFYPEKELESGLCPIHHKKAERIKEETYFFRMSKYQRKILEHIESNQDFIQPATRRKEIINRVKAGIKDLSVSRTSFRWGIPVPINKQHIIFVWLDALTNYISVLGYPNGKFRKYWPADVHLIGKDILWFHSVVWPAMLLAADIELPRKIFVHGFINIKGEKISKSKGATIDPVELVNRYDPDALRYFLLREIPFGADGDFSEAALIKRINADLANDLGNLLHRTLTMIEKYFMGKIPNAQESDVLDGTLITQAKGLPEKYFSAMDKFEFGLALESIWALINTANKYIEDAQPWSLLKEKKNKRLATVMANLTEVLRLVSILIYPFIPRTAQKMHQQMNWEIDLDRNTFDKLLKWPNRLSGSKIKKGRPLFPRVI